MEKMKITYTPELKKVIFFDMNRTLIDPKQSFRDSFLEILEEYTGRWQQDTFSPAQILQIYLEQWQKQRKSKTKSSLSPDQIRRKCLAQALQSLPIPNKERFVRIFWQQTKARQDKSPRLYADVRETLGRLLEKSYKLAVISNGSKAKQEQQLKLLNLQSLIPPNHLFSSQNGGVRKPNPQLFQHALQAMRVSSSQAVMVGDSWKNDIVGAVNSGMDAIWLRPTHDNKQSPHRKLGSRQVIVIRHFNQLDAIF
jgi:HAD superfamily hydrolase (TIGR01662 family)